MEEEGKKNSLSFGIKKTVFCGLLSCLDNMSSVFGGYWFLVLIVCQCLENGFL